MSFLAWLLLGLVPATIGAATLPWSPGYALALNSYNTTEYAYSYPRRLYQQFTVEMWLRGYAQVTDYLALFTVAHPKLDNAFVITNNVWIFDTFAGATPTIPPGEWGHIAVSIDITGHPDFDSRIYLNGEPVQNVTGQLLNGLNASDLEQEVLAFVFGQEQDKVLGDFNVLQTFSGHLDEVRIWNTSRTPDEIRRMYRLSLTSPYPAGLVSYYSFDLSDWAAGFHVDEVNGTEQHRLYLSDYAAPDTAATPPPTPPATTPPYAPPAAPPARLALSTAPLCKTDPSGGFAALRVSPGGSASVPAASLYCSPTGTVATVTVTAVRGGAVFSKAQNALNVPLATSATLTFTADSSGVAANAGFNFTVGDGATTTAGFVAVWPNQVPTIPPELRVVVDEDTVVTAWIAVMDADRDVVTVAVVAPPSRGVGQMDGNINRSVQYTPPHNVHGSNVGVFTLQATDMWGAVSSTMLVSVTLKPIPDQPHLLVNTSFTIYRGQRVTIPFQAVDVDGNDPFVVLSDWPSGSQGYVEGVDGGVRRVINELSASSKAQWASGYGDYSSTFYNRDYSDYDLPQIVGPPQCSGYGDCNLAWCPAKKDGNCINRASADEAYYIFYTEFFEVNFTTPLYLTNIILVENLGSDRVSRVQVPSDRDPAKWKTILSRDIAASPASAAIAKYSVTSLPVCQVLWRVDRVRIEVDTCHRDGWYEVDAVQMRGGVVAPKNVLNTTAQLYFRATPGYTGNASFGLTATTCYGSFEATSDLVTVTVEVRDTPHVLTVDVNDGWFAIDVGKLDCGPRQGNVLVLELPSSGTLRYMGRLLNDTLIDLGAAATVFEYEPFRCNALLTDAFLIQMGPTAVVQVKIRGCTTTMSLLIPIVVPCVVGPACIVFLALVWAWMRRGHRDNSRAPKDPHRDICVLFTDIQASTLLWGELPDVMSVALDAHNVIIRKLIAAYKCYEVKTIGDSFMIVVSEPGLALQLALAIQEVLYDHGGAGDKLDDVYCRLTDCNLPCGAYDRLWHCLRVRVGMHYGRAQITFDETSKGYDYYGTVVNTAARIESVAHGGQIVASRQLFDQVAHRCSVYRVATQPLGCVQLRGLPAPLDLVQLLPIRFADREFPPLRLDRQGHDKDDPEDGQSEAMASGPSSDTGQHAQLYPQSLDREAPHHPLVRAGTVTAELAVFHAYGVFYALKAMLQMHKTPEERKNRLRDLCQQWHVPCKVATDQQENTSVGKLALQLMGPVANQMHPNLKARASSVGSHGSSSVPSPPTHPPFWDQSGDVAFARRHRPSHPSG